MEANLDHCYYFFLKTWQIKYLFNLSSSIYMPCTIRRWEINFVSFISCASRIFTLPVCCRSAAHIYLPTLATICDVNAEYSRSSFLIKRNLKVFCNQFTPIKAIMPLRGKEVKENVTEFWENRKANHNQETRHKPLLLLKRQGRRVNRAIDESIYSYCIVSWF